MSDMSEAYETREIASEAKVTYRWIRGAYITDAEWDTEMSRIEAIMATRGWMQLAKDTSILRVAEQDGKLVGFFVLQLMPHLEPLWVAPGTRGTDVAQTLVNDMLAFASEINIRGFVVTAENSAAARMCEAHEMTKVDVPVYVRVP